MELVERGDPAGPVLLFLPGSYSTAAAWRPVEGALEGRYRLLATSLPGYGKTAEVRDPQAPAIEALADWLAELVERLDADVHLVTHSFGGFVALEAIQRGLVLASLIGFEANPISWTVGGQAPWQGQVAEMCDALGAALAKGDPEAAGVIIDFYGGSGCFAAMPDPVRAYCRETAPVNLLDWRSALGGGRPVEALASTSLPMTLVCGSEANAAVAGINAALAAAVPQARAEVVEGAGHFLISTHPKACAALVDAHMRRVEG